MVSLFRLKGRALQIGSITLLQLTFFTGLLLVVTVNLLPVVYSKGISSYFVKSLSEYFQMINLFFSVVFLITAFGVYGAVNLGIKRYFLKKAQKKNADSRDIFCFFRPGKFFSSLFYLTRITFVRLMIACFCFLPYTVCFSVVYRFSSFGVSAMVCLALFVTAIFLLFNGVYFYLSFSASFFLCDYYFIEGSYISFGHLIACSQKNMVKNTRLLSGLRLSFSGWFLICVLILPVPYVWSYYNQTLAVAAADFMKVKS